MHILEDIDPDNFYYDYNSPCSYYGARLLKSKFSDDTDSLKILHFIIRSAKKN